MKNDELRFGVDVDGVLADVHTRWCNMFNAQTGRNTTINDIRQWNFWRDFGITEENFLEMHARIWDDWRLIPPTEENLSAKVAALQQFGVVDILTARRQSTVEPAVHWLAAHRIPYRTLVVTQNTVDKAVLGYDVFIDDSDIVMTAVSRKPETWGILYARPWTENLPLPHKVWRMRTWAELPTIMEQILKGR